MESPEIECTLEALIENLSSPDEGRRDEAFEILMEEVGSLETAEVRTLLDALSHPETIVRQAVSAALSGVQKLIEAADSLATGLRDPDPTVRGNIAIALGTLGPSADRLLPDLNDALGAEDNDWASAAILETIRQIESMS